MKFYFLLVLSLSINFCSAQIKIGFLGLDFNKSKQIDILNKRIDSLNAVIYDNRKNHTKITHLILMNRRRLVEVSKAAAEKAQRNKAKLDKIKN